MRSIGIRVASNEIFYAVFEGNPSEPKLFFYNKLTIPKSYKDGQALSWIRENFLNILKEYQIKSMFIRTMELRSQTKKKAIMDRSKIEGVLCEVGYTSGAKTRDGALTTITSLMVTQTKKSAKGYMELDEFRGVEEWTNLNDKYREASLAGVAALALLEDSL
ncbi:hypothetical protein J2T13_004628 [Paenibacillus sp. DS2015]|uniref:hypothetical protein n=1 Tax=Paenibacillus sp. DS2015 TaxID=3373917 RepID=UPI003D223A91